MDKKEIILNFLTYIPKGKVVTYQTIAKYLDNKNLARYVGNVLHDNIDVLKYPCFKVVNSQGKLAKNYAFGGIDGQKKLLEKEDIEVINYKVDLKKYEYLMNMEEIILNKTKLYCQNILKENDIAHDFSHVLRVYNTSLKIASHYQCDLFLVKMLALLHDIDDEKLVSHATNKISVKEFLESLNLDSNFINKIFNILPFMSFHKYKILPEEIPLEAKIVVDADRLDAIGAIGVARVFAYSSYIKRPFYDDSSQGSALDHFQEKLLTLHNYLHTEIAKKMALKRQQFILDFYNEFKEEVGIKNDN